LVIGLIDTISYVSLFNIILISLVSPTTFSINSIERNIVLAEPPSILIEDLKNVGSNLHFTLCSTCIEERNKGLRARKNIQLVVEDSTLCDLHQGNSEPVVTEVLNEESNDTVDDDVTEKPKGKAKK